MEIKQILNNENGLLKLLFEKNASIIELTAECERLMSELMELKEKNKPEDD